MTKIQVQIKNGQLLPVSQYDAERLEDAKQGQVFNLTATGHRSNPHHNLYWSTLRSVCKATGKGSIRNNGSKWYAKVHGHVAYADGIRR